MYKLSVGLLLVAATGCSTNEMHFEQRTELASRTSSVVLYDDGSRGQGSMNEQACLFDTQSGFIIADYDLPTADERIEDVRGTVAIARTVEGIHVIDENGWDRDNDIALGGVRHAKMTESGVASMLSDDAGCRIDWRDDATIATASLSADVCAVESEFVVDRPTGQVFVAFGSDVVTALPDGTVQSFGIPGDLLSLDEVTGNISIASRGGDTVTTVSASGDVQWTSSLEGSVFDMTDFGARGATAIVVDGGHGVSLQAFDAGSGEAIADYDLPSVADVVVSADASTIGLVTPDVVYFYDVFEGAAPVVFNEVATQPPEMFAD